MNSSTLFVVDLFISFMYYECGPDRMCTYIHKEQLEITFNNFTRGL